jgi:hypothetical protein
MYSTLLYLYIVGAAGSVVFGGNRGDDVDRPEEVLDGIEDVSDENGENGEGVESKSYGGDNRDGSSVSVTRNGFSTSLATLMMTSYVFANSRSGSAYNHIFGSRMTRGPSGYAFSRSTDSAYGISWTVGSV